MATLHEGSDDLATGGKAPRRRVYKRKTDVVLAAAERAFLQSGYAATSMDAVAEMANVSKRTVYSNFGSKQDLFAAVIRKRCAEAVPEALDRGRLETDNPQDVLVAMAAAFLTTIYSPVQVELYQTVVAESRQFPELGRIMIDGPIQQTQTIFDEFLHEQVRLGHLSFPDPSIAAAQLIGMLKTNIHMRLLFNQPVSLKPKDLRAKAESTVALFLDGARPRR
jgi:TetR/AcrR family transcriptional repressor of mexJK operon